MTDINKTLEERGKTHGNWHDQAWLCSWLKFLMRNNRIGKFEELSASQAEALDMIAVKISRILTGNPNEPDHWRDIAGYATLAEKELLK